MDSSGSTPGLRQQPAYQGGATSVLHASHPSVAAVPARPPALQTVAASVPLLPQDVVPGILRRLPLVAYRHARLVCRDWSRMASSVRIDLALRTVADDLLGNDNAQIDGAAFKARLATLDDCYPMFMHEALYAVADILASVRADQRRECFLLLVKDLERRPLSQQRWLLCALAARLGRYLREDDGRSVPASTAGDVWLDAVLATARHQPVAGQALVLAALCGDIDGWLPQVSRPVERLQSLAKSWSDLDVHQAKPALALALRCALLAPGIQAAQIAELRRFGFYTVRLDTFELRGRYRDLVAICRGIVESDLEPWEKRRLLRMCDGDGVPFLCRSGSALATVVKAYEEVVEDDDELTLLLAATDATGMPAVHRLLHERICRFPHTADHTFDRAPHLRRYLRRIASSGRLSDAAKLRLLRGEVRARPVGPPRFGAPGCEFEIGPRRDKPFLSLSVIDSLCCDATMGFLRGYMEEILRFALPPALKAEVLRLDYPDRAELPRMQAAHCLYVNTIMQSDLPRHLRQTLTNGMPNTFEATCQLL